MEPTRDTLTAHYEKAYYEGHHGRFLQDGGYCQAVGTFYEQEIFTPAGLSRADRVLDFGSGPGHLTSTLGADCFDPSQFIQDHLRQQQRRVYGRLEEVPRGVYRAVFSSHALEHSMAPASELSAIHELLVPGGTLILVLPMEAVPGAPASQPDDNRHFYVWTFQTITNLLLALNFKVDRQQVFYGPFALRTLLRYMPASRAASWAARLGRLMRNYPSLMTVARRS